MKKFLTLIAVVFGAVALHAGEYPDISITELKSAIAAKNVITRPTPVNIPMRSQTPWLASPTGVPM